MKVSPSILACFAAFALCGFASNAKAQVTESASLSDTTTNATGGLDNGSVTLVSSGHAASTGDRSVAVSIYNAAPGGGIGTQVGSTSDPVAVSGDYNFNTKFSDLAPGDYIGVSQLQRPNGNGGYVALKTAQIAFTIGPKQTNPPGS